MSQTINLILVVIPFIIIPIVWYFKRNQIKEFTVETCSKAWERIVAFIIDSIICLFLLIGCRHVLSYFYLTNQTAVYFFGTLFVWLYFAIFESSKLQATFGKIFENIMVVNVKAKRISFMQSSLRFFLFVFSLSYGGLGLITIIPTKYKQGVHELVSNTVVIKRGPAHE